MDPDYAAGKFYDALVKINNWVTDALGRALLEEADRVTIAVVEIPDSGFLVRGGKSDRGCARRQAAAYRNTGNDRGVMTMDTRVPPSRPACGRWRG
jgi:hypothetical protein